MKEAAAHSRIYCFNCGESIGANSRFCPNCGAEQLQPIHKKESEPTKPKVPRALENSAKHDIKHYTEEDKALAKEWVKKAEKSVDNAAHSAAALGWISLYAISGIVLLFYSVGSWEKSRLILTLILSFIGALLMVYYGTYAQAVYRRNTRAALWLCLLISLLGIGSLLPLIVSIYCVAALIRLRKLRKTRYFQLKAANAEPFKLSGRAIVIILIAAIIAVVTLGFVAKNAKSVAITRDDYITNCTSGANSNLSASQAQQYCACTYDTGTQQYGEAKYTKLVAEYDSNAQTPTEVQGILNQCSSQLQ